MPQRVLIVDDEPDIVELIEYNLIQARYVIGVANDGAGAFAEIERRRPDLVLLDLMLPDMSGKEICKRMKMQRSTEAIPIIMITACGDEIDRVIGFELGADDYIVKPFSPRELVLRAQAVLRRSTMTTQSTGEGFVIARSGPVGRLEIDVPRHRVLVDGQSIVLTAFEFMLLLDLASRRGRVQSRETLLRRVWGYGPDVETRTVDTHVGRLRQKLGSARDYIETVRGIGYRVRDDLGES